MAHIMIILGNHACVVPKTSIPKGLEEKIGEMCRGYMELDDKSFDADVKSFIENLEMHTLTAVTADLSAVYKFYFDDN